MDIEQFDQFCMGKAGVEQSYPFGEPTLVYKVMGKMFALINVDLFESINLKCNPDNALELREKYNGIKPGYHMNKKHWNTVMINSDIPDSLMYDLIDDSYNLVVSKLSKKEKARLGL